MHAYTFGFAVFAFLVLETKKNPLVPLFVDNAENHLLTRYFRLRYYTGHTILHIPCYI